MPRGAGKTRVALEALYQLGVHESNTPTLIVCPRTAIAHWKNEIKKWTHAGEEDIIVARAVPQTRKWIWENRKNWRFIIVTYGTLIQDQKHVCKPVQWKAVICDEAHKFRNRKTKTFTTVKALSHEIGAFLSGSIFRSQVLDVWTLLHLSDKQTFSSFWRFVNTFVHVFDGPFGKEFGGPRNMQRFRELLARHAVYVSMDEVAEALPSRNRQYLDVEIEGNQKKTYDRIWSDLIVELDSGNLLVSPNEMTQIMRARQCLCCPAILDESLGVGSGFESIVEHGEENPHYIVFTPFAKAIPYFKEYLEKQGYKSVYTIQGGMDPDEQQRVTREFEADRGILLCTIGVAESWESTTTNQVYFLGYDWSPDVNAQAEDRVRRASSGFAYVNAHYVRHLGTYDEDTLFALNEKVKNIKPALFDPRQLRATLTINSD